VLPRARFAPKTAGAISAGQASEEPGRDERGDQQRAHRLVLQVGHVRAGPGDQPGLGVRVQQGVGEPGRDDAGQIRHGEAVVPQQDPHRHLSCPGLA
jgi:hypothetical protein